MNKLIVSTIFIACACGSVIAADSTISERYAEMIKKAHERAVVRGADAPLLAKYAEQLDAGNNQVSDEDRDALQAEAYANFRINASEKDLFFKK